MQARRATRSPALFFALAAAIWSGPSLAASEPHTPSTPAASVDAEAREPAPVAPAGGFVAAQHRVSAREYHASSNDRGLQAPNRAHNLRTYFDATGIRVHDRTRADAPELLALNLAGVGRGETPTRVGPGEVTSHGARVEIARPGFVEWYENSPAGVEQGVTLERRPAGDGPLVVELSVRGARASLRGDGVRFATPTGRQLSFAKLAAIDAHGRALEARFRLPDPARLQLLVDDADATYPVIIDPLLTAIPDAQFESNQLSGGMGSSVAGAGDVNGDGYDDVIVGASGYDAGQLNEGAAFIFLGGPDGIADGNPSTAATQIESNQANAYLGVSVAGAGDVNGDGYDDVIVGAYLYDFDQADEGAAFVFHGSAAGIADGNPSMADAVIESDQVDAQLGYSVASAGDIDNDGYDDVLVGAYRYDTGLANPLCTDESIATGDNRGFHPWLCCTGLGTGTCLDEGAVLVFRGSAAGIAGGGPADADTLLLSNEEASWLGWSVASAGDVNGDGYDDILLGAPAYDSINPPNRPVLDWGIAYIFHGGPAGIPDGTDDSAATWFVPNRDISQLGNSVAGAGDVNGDGYDDVLIGAYRYEKPPPKPPPRLPTRGPVNEGWTVIYHGSAAGVPNGGLELWTGCSPPCRPNGAAPDTELRSSQLVALMGSSIAGIGDIDGDGYDDVLVGAQLYDAGEEDEGAAFVYLGSADGVASGVANSAALRLESNQPFANFGFSVASAGDVNGDGAPDVIVGAPLYDNGKSGEGAAFVYLGEPVDEPVPEPALIGGLAAGVACLAALARRRRRGARAR